MPVDIVLLVDLSDLLDLNIYCVMPEWNSVLKQICTLPKSKKYTPQSRHNEVTALDPTRVLMLP